MTRISRAAWLTPLVACLIIYQYGLRVWFMQDDFAWLSLPRLTPTFGSLWHSLFAPMAQGTIRPWSERAFFLIFTSLFGLHAFPFRLFVFLNQFANLVLLGMIARKLTPVEGLRDVAGIAAPLIWLSSMTLVTPMAWSSAYNEVQYSGFLLLGFYLFLRFVESGERKYYVAQWIVFVLGFGSLELNVVYPAVVAAFSLCCSRKHLNYALAMLPVSLVYAVIHRVAAGSPKDFYYHTMLDSSSLAAAGWYWRVSLGAAGLPSLGLRTRWAGLILCGILTAAILGFVVRQARARSFLPLFFLAWYAITLAPFLLVPRHLVSYYAMVPSIGLALLAAAAVSMAWRSSPIWRIAVGLLLFAYAAPSLADIDSEMRDYYRHSERVRSVVASVAYAERLHPSKVILLADLDDELFWDCISDSPFRLFGWNNVFATPESRAAIRADPHLQEIDPYLLSFPAAVNLLKRDQAVVYSVKEAKLRNVTRSYGEALLAAHPKPELSSRVDLGVTYYDEQLGPGWYEPQPGFRWMSAHGILYLAGPSEAGNKLYVRGNCLEEQLREGPLHLSISVDGRALPVSTIDRDHRDFVFEYDLPADLVGRAKIEVALAVDRTYRVPDDTREYGLVLAEVGLR